MMNKTLTELEGHDWGEPKSDSHLVIRIHQLRKTPLHSFGTEDLRITIGQRVGLQFLLPVALSMLEENPFAEGDYYPGDLLAAVVRSANEDLWRQNAEMRERLARILSNAMTGFANSGAPEELEVELRRALIRVRDETQ